MSRRLSLLPILIFAFTGCASQGKPVTKVSASSHELAAGETIHQQILQDFRPLNNSAINAYVQRVTSKLACHAKRNLNYHVTVLQDERIYATSAPGGEIYITSSFLTFLKSESELAAIVGHEIGELQFTDPQFNPLRKTADGVTKAGTMVGPLFGQIGALATLGLVGLHAAYARDPDLETRVLASDRWAMQTLLAENYEPQALLDVLTHFAKYNRQFLSSFYDYYQSRPINVKRVNAAQAEFKKLDLEGKDLQTHFEEYRKQMDRLGSAQNT